MTTKTVTDSNAAVIENRSQLIDSFARGEKPKERWRIGTEHEKFVYAKSDLHAPSYDEPGGIRDLLTGLTEFGRSEEHTSELQSLMRISYAVFCLKKKKQ